MRTSRPVKSCSRCRDLKVRCDRSRPCCGRCERGKVLCSFQIVLSPSATLSPSDIADDPLQDELSHGAILGSRLAASNETSTSPDGFDSRDVAASLPLAKPKRRQRACLSCVRCHRLKVKCDKKEPCTRCRQSGFGPQCEFTHRVDTTPAQHESGFGHLKGDDRHLGVVTSSWLCRMRGSSHWRDLLDKIKSSDERLSQSTVKRHLQSLTEDISHNLTLPINFPFNSPGAVKYSSLSAVCNFLQRHKKNCSRYVNKYLDVFHHVHPILDPVELHEQIEKFWDDGKSDKVSWLAQFCMILGLGCFAETYNSDEALQFCLAGEACLAQSAFMVRPTVACIRAMCLMVLAKLISNGTCWSLDACWTLVGFLLRQAACLGLHRQRAPHSEMTASAVATWEEGQTLWSTVLYFGIQTSITSGMPSFLRPDEVIFGNDAYPLVAGTPNDSERLWQTAVRASAPLILEISGRVNSDNDQPSYRETIDYNTRVRQLMAILDDYNVPRALRITLDLHYRRVLLILHRKYALATNGPYVYAVSYWASLECSLALLVHQREMMTDMEKAPDGMYLLSRCFMLDFFGAALTASLHLLREDAPLADGTAIPPRETILNTLEACRDIWAQEKKRSACFFSAFSLLTDIVAVLEQKRESKARSVGWMDAHVTRMRQTALDL